MRKKLILSVLFISFVLSNNAYANDGNIKIREYFEQIGWQIDWDNENKTAELFDISSENKLIIYIKDNIAKFNNNIYFNSFTIENNSIYTNSEILNALDKLNSEPVYDDAKLVINPEIDNVTKDYAINKAIKLIQKLYGINTEKYNISCIYYNNNTCNLMLESEKITFIVTIDSKSGELLAIDRTVNKSDFSTRGEITGERIAFYDEKIPKIINEFNYFGNLKTLFYFIPDRNTSTVYSFLMDDKDNYYAFEFTDNGLNPIGIHIFKNFDSAVNEINKWF